MASNGAGPEPGPINVVEIKLDKVRHLLFDFKALRIAEKQIFSDWGEKISVTKVLGPDITVTDLTTLLWAALVHEDPSLTLDQISVLLHLNNIEYVAAKVEEAFRDQAAANEGEETADPQKP